MQGRFIYPKKAARYETADSFIDVYRDDKITDAQRMDVHLFDDARRNVDWAERRKIFEFLVGEGLDVTLINEGDKTNQLHALAGRINRKNGEDLELFEKLLEWECDPNFRSPKFGTPFDVINDKFSCDDTMLLSFVKLLVKHGFDVCRPGLDGKTPLEAVEAIVENDSSDDESYEFRGKLRDYLATLTKERC